MEYGEVLAQLLALPQRERRLSYRVLKRRFGLDDDVLEDLKEDLIYAKRVAVDEDSRVLVWRGEAGVFPRPSVLQTTPPSGLPESALVPVEPPSDAERRQLTVLFCDLVDSTRLARCPFRKSCASRGRPRACPTSGNHKGCPYVTTGGVFMKQTSSRDVVIIPPCRSDFSRDPRRRTCPLSRLKPLLQPRCDTVSLRDDL
jgi:hypothetical protein